ncbi:MAG: hypothetical protein BWY99_02659 [Synergistetes bacterium ADurb.BinA166]|nr:MAG: hypothetical protein BWY99_02659 [Synergistetes bacterium ADurb.BinA166]
MKTNSDALLKEVSTGMPWRMEWATDTMSDFLS